MKHLVVKDLNNPEILKIEIRSDFPENAICEIDEALVGKAFKVIDEVDQFGVTIKKAVLDEVAEQARLDLIAQKEAENAALKAEFKAIVTMYKSLDPDLITNLADAKLYLKKLNQFLKAAFKATLDNN